MSESEAYRLLGLNHDCSREDVENALRSKSKEFHPDRNPDKEDWATQQQKKINTAYDLIKSARERPESNERTKPCEGQKQSSPPEQKAREQKAREQKAREQKAREQKAREQEAREQEAREQEAREQEARWQRAREQRARWQRAREQAEEKQSREQLAIEKRAAQIHEARKNGTLVELLRSWGEYVPDEKTQYEDGSQWKEWAQYHDDIPSPKRQNSTCNWQSGDSKQTQPKNSPISQKSYWPKKGQSKETSGLQRFGEFIRFLIDEIIFLCLGS